MRIGVPMEIKPLEGRVALTPEAAGELVRAGHEVFVQAGAGAAESPHREATVWLAIVKKSADVAIPRGENAGKSITYTNVVRELAPVGMWTGKPMQIRLARSAMMRAEADACVVLLQAGDGGPIIGAAWMAF